MKSLAKMLAVATALNDSDLLTPTSPRLELKRGKSGHFRLYIPIAPVPGSQVVPSVQELLKTMQVDVNPFQRAGVVTAFTFVDFDEASAD